MTKKLSKIAKENYPIFSQLARIKPLAPGTLT